MRTRRKSWPRLAASSKLWARGPSQQIKLDEATTMHSRPTRLSPAAIALVFAAILAYALLRPHPDLDLKVHLHWGSLPHDQSSQSVK